MHGARTRGGKQIQIVLFDIPKKEGLTVPVPVPEPVTEVSLSECTVSDQKRGSIHACFPPSRSPSVQGLHAVRIPQQARRARTGTWQSRAIRTTHRT
ncbi:unnamed protein product [Periconia digitata]|uniref:Uncharacterized protein n=1 Tax=Periconia digitata TaxID=1303443 RepID=A0A9W4UFK1_9PLEO|nr:unnamed protein product [Periconia digitata]